jgi:hypothetical protein
LLLLKQKQNNSQFSHFHFQCEPIVSWRRPSPFSFSPFRFLCSFLAFCISFFEEEQKELIHFWGEGVGEFLFNPLYFVLEKLQLNIVGFL